jgi:hypothetical protein
VAPTVWGPLERASLNPKPTFFETEEINVIFHNNCTRLPVVINRGQLQIETKKLMMLLS